MHTTQHNGKAGLSGPQQADLAHHFTSGNYLAIKANGGVLHVRMDDGETAVDAALKLDDELKRDASRIARQRARLAAFLTGKTISNPDALR